MTKNSQVTIRVSDIQRKLMDSLGGPSKALDILINYYLDNVDPSQELTKKLKKRQDTLKKIVED